MANFKDIKTWSVDDLAGVIARRNDRKEEVGGNIANTIFVDGGMYLADEGVAVDKVTPTALKQIWGTAGFNGSQIDLISNHLTRAEQTALYEREITGHIETEKMFRVHNRPDGKKELYAVVSPRYKIMDNDVVLDIINAHEGTALLPVVGTKMSMDHSKFRFIPENMRSFNVGDHLPMVEITNSESGIGSLSIWAGVYTIKCTNGMMVAGNFDHTRMVHLGNNYDVPSLGSVFNQALESVERLFKAESRYMSIEAKSNVIDFVKARGLSHDDVDAMVQYANTNYSGGRSLADVVGAFTHSAQRKGIELVKRSKIETVAGELLERFAA